MPHVLLVDDEPSQRQALRRVLEARDYKVAEASGVHEAETRHNLSEFDLIVTELVAARFQLSAGQPGSCDRDDQLRQPAIGS